MEISKQEIQERLEHFKRINKDKGLPVTPQKLAIFNILAASTNHPDVNFVYNKVKDEFPNISLATVYNNLNRFVQLGLATEINVPGGVSRYDARTEDHVHAIDLEKGLVYDVLEGLNDKEAQRLFGKRIKRKQLTYYL